MHISRANSSIFDQKIMNIYVKVSQVSQSKKLCHSLQAILWSIKNVTVFKNMSQSLCKKMSHFFVSQNHQFQNCMWSHLVINVTFCHNFCTYCQTGLAQMSQLLSDLSHFYHNLCHIWVTFVTICVTIKSLF